MSSFSEDDNDDPDDQNNHDDLPNINLSGDDSDCPQATNSAQVRHEPTYYSSNEHAKNPAQSKSAQKRDRGFSFLSNSTSADSVDTDQDEDGEPITKRHATAAMRMMVGCLFV